MANMPTDLHNLISNQTIIEHTNHLMPSNKKIEKQVVCAWVVAPLQNMVIWSGEAGFLSHPSVQLGMPGVNCSSMHGNFENEVAW